MIRAVLDTNLIVSYLLTQGATLSRLIALWEEDQFVYLVSPAILAELVDVLRRPRLCRYMKADPNTLLDVISQDAEQVPGELVLAGVSRDPKDDMFIACAVEGNADYVVTGDKDLLDMGSYEGVQIIRPAAFVELFTQN